MTTIKRTAGNAAVTLSEKDLYCIARHLFSYHHNAMREEIADFARPCLTCRYALDKTCTDEPSVLDHMPAFIRLSNVTGVRFSMCANEDFGELEGKQGSGRVHL